MSTPYSKALFLDRDGIIIEDAGYTKDPALVKLIPSVITLIQAAHQRNYKIIIVTNQSGIGRGSIALHHYQSVTHRMLELLEAQQALYIDQIYFAPFYEFAAQPVLPIGQPYSIENKWNIPHHGVWSAEWRKPNLGMIGQAQQQFAVDLSSSLMVGDRWTDQLLAVNSSIKIGVWYCSSLESLYENSEFLSHQSQGAHKIRVVHDLSSATQWLE